MCNLHDFYLLIKLEVFRLADYKIIAFYEECEPLSFLNYGCFNTFLYFGYLNKIYKIVQLAA